MKTLSKVSLVTILFSFAIFHIAAEVDSYVQNLHGGHIGHSGGHTAHTTHTVHNAHAAKNGEHTGIHGEHSHHEGDSGQHKHADLSCPDPSFYTQFNDNITPCQNAQHDISLCEP